MSVSNYTDIGITKSQITTKGGRLTVSDSANQGYATPNGSSGNAGLRALVAADLPTSDTWAFGGALSGNITYTGNGNYPNRHWIRHSPEYNCIGSGIEPEQPIAGNRRNLFWRG
jgi:hypothetical protein